MKFVLRVLFVVGLSVAFGFGYFYGTRSANNYALEYSQQLMDQQAAAKAANNIIAMGELIVDPAGGSVEACKLKSLIERNVLDWEKCKATPACASSVSGEYFSKVDEVMRRYHLLTCL